MSPWVTLAVGAAVTIFMLVAHRTAQRITGHADDLSFDVERGNVARALAEVGSIVGIFLVAASVVANSGHHEDLLTNLGWMGAFAVMGIVLFDVSARIGMRAILQSRLVAELARGNVAAGVAAGAHSVATGIIVSRSIGGATAKDVGLSFVFFLIAQLSLHAVVAAFRWLTPYDDGEEILGENLAAALSYAGLTIAVAIVVGRAVEGSFTGWRSSLTGYAIALGYALALYVVRQVFVEMLLLGGRPTLRRGKLDTAIARQRNVAAGALEGVTYVASALFVLRVAS